MKKLLLLAGVLLTTLAGIAQQNITFRSNLPYNGNALSNIGGYADSLGNEYALVGYEQGLSIVDVTDPANPSIVVDVPGITSIWREVKTWQHYAYVTTEGCCDGLQIVDLSYLPDSVSVKYWDGGSPLNNQLQTIHALHIDQGYVYLYGSNLFNGSALVVDLSDPWNPVYQGHTPGTYIHDGYVRNDTLWGAHIYDGYFAVYDVANKTNPVLLASQITPTQFTHNTWLNDAGTVLFTTDENNGSYLASFDITDLSNIVELDQVQVTPGSGSIVHNTHTLNDFEVVSWYKDGVAIVDVSQPDNMIITGHYDTYTQGSGSGFNGAWGVYPFLPSGNLVVSDIDNGLFVLTPTYVRGCYLEGVVTDSVSGLPINNAIVTLVGQSISKNTRITGEYKTGLATAGTYTVQVSKPGYNTKTITGINLQNGVLTQLDVQLSASVSQVTLSGSVTETGTGLPIAGASIQLTGTLGTVDIQSDASGQFSVPGFFVGNYVTTAGKWGYQTYCDNGINITAATSPLTIQLSKGYYDDFALDFGWTVSGPSSNVWERSVPIGTTNQGIVCNPNADVPGDCRDLAMITDNGGGGGWDNDVDQGNTILTSPVFDATTYLNPVISYQRWFYNGGTTNGQPDDSLKIYLTDGVTTVPIELLGPPSSSSLWKSYTFRIADFINPGPQMQIIFDIGDPGPVFNIVEGGLDQFRIDEFVSIDEISQSSFHLSVRQNPFAEQTTLYISGQEAINHQLQIFNTEGKLVQSTLLKAGQTELPIGKDLTSGFYLVRVSNEQGTARSLKLIKQ